MLCKTKRYEAVVSTLDCEKFLFLFRFCEGGVRARADARNEGGSPRRKEDFSCLSLLAPLVSRVGIFMSCVFGRRTKKTKRLFVEQIQ